MYSGCIVMCWLALLPLALILVLLLVLLLALLHLPSELAALGAGVLVVLGCCWWQRRRCATQCHTVPAQCHTVQHSATQCQTVPHSASTTGALWSGTPTPTTLVCTTPANDAALPNCIRVILLVYQLLNDESGVFVCTYLCICLCICVILGEVL